LAKGESGGDGMMTVVIALVVVVILLLAASVVAFLYLKKSRNNNAVAPDTEKKEADPAPKQMNEGADFGDVKNGRNSLQPILPVSPTAIDTASGATINRGPDGQILLPTMLDLEASVRRRFTKAVRAIQSVNAFTKEGTGAPGVGAGEGGGGGISWASDRDANAELAAARSRRASALGMSMPGASSKGLPSFAALESSVASGPRVSLVTGGPRISAVSPSTGSERKNTGGPRISAVSPSAVSERKNTDGPRISCVTNNL
jgi:hypothetical protein